MKTKRSSAEPKLQPKLRMIINGSSIVNTIRAEHCGCLKVKRPSLLGIPIQRGEASSSMERSDLPKAISTPRSLKAVSDDVSTNAFVLFRDSPEIKILGETGRDRSQRIVTVSVPLSKLTTIADRPDVLFVEAAQGLTLPEPVRISQAIQAPEKTLRAVEGKAFHGDAAKVLVGIIDVQGFDFAHPDFLDSQGRTRFVRIWDQGGGHRPPPDNPAFSYGSELTDQHLNAALKNASNVGVSAQDLEPQSEMAASSHGTHVASIAAGNHGVARKAVLAGVLVSLGPGDMDPRKSFYDSTRIAHAVDYLLDLGNRLKLPVSINVSLGTNGHAHDGSSAVSRWIDAAFSLPGRAICVAAGNAGQEKAKYTGDLGYVMGRIHTSGRIESTGLVRDLDWNIVGNGRVDISENELEIWYEPQDKFAVSLKAPGSNEWIGPVEPRQFIQNRQLKDGTFISIYNEVFHPANGLNYISIYLTPFFSDAGVVGVASGIWTVRLHGREIRDGRYHGWIERDDPRPRGRNGPREYWNFPSYFSERSNVDESSVSSLACGHRVISVANLEVEEERINITSSDGPTRDDRLKPDIAAVGTDVVAANGFAPEEPWIAMTGTSMASPYVCGLAALMLAIEPKLTAVQIESIMRRTARPLPSKTYAWSKESGFGIINPSACIEEARVLNLRKEIL